MGVGVEMIFFLILLVISGYIIYRLAFRGKSRLRAADFTGPTAGPRRWATIAAGVLLISVIALTFEFCSEQQNRMEKNTYEDSSLDNEGKGENDPDADDDNPQK